MPTPQYRRWIAALAVALLACPVGCTRADNAAPAAATDAASAPLAPEFPADAIWIGTDKPPTMQSLRGQVVIVDFWDYTCINCIRTFPHLKQWYARYHDKGLAIVGVHKGEFAFAQNADNVRKAYARFALPYPAIADVKDEIWNLFRADAWPQSFLIDRAGRIRSVHTGEGDYGQFEKEIQDLLREGHPDLNFDGDTIAADSNPFAAGGPMSAETYVGYERGSLWGAQIANAEDFQPDKVVDYAPTNARPDHGFFVSGKWLNKADYFESVPAAPAAPEPAPATLGIRYHATDVYVVLQRASAQPGKLLVERDGQPVPPGQRGKDVQVDDTGRTFILIDQPRLYYAISHEDDSPHDLLLIPQSPGQRICSFTFGNKMLQDFDRR